MGQFQFSKTEIAGLFLIEPKKWGDERGYFMETYNEEDFRKAGISTAFVQDNQSRSQKGVLRGMHFQKQNPQGKLVRVIDGLVFDAVVDLRKGSSTFGKSYGVLLSAENCCQIFIPEGFAHGFLVLSDYATVVYKTTRFYDPGDEGGVLWNDPDLGIHWPLEGIGEPIMKEQDKNYPRLKDLKI